MPGVMYLICACGHEGVVAPDMSGQRLKTLRRARCTACGRKGAVDLKLVWQTDYAPNIAFEAPGSESN